MILIKLDRHTANRTSAKTWWTILQPGRELSLEEAEKEEKIQFVFSTHSAFKTHWHEYYYAKPGLILKRNRISNSGNYSYTYFSSEDLKVDESEIPRRMVEANKR